ncbi:MAG: EF-P lysine aminoacylase GenX [Candidatus Magasanikbacteria bacterium CG_4_10_14_0_2_um_filter_33_14]|uniref:EF-P lysine aminoacylase GenX n=1 Tax=Candidatus Magasanikbacteria bacterium CG_4_10_14_0_2_um_filter_33_14 TaxID=1974636 RepID=A0A2M7VAB9_9BACT|nr:MAG: EF-P lysine aminoacylase GenX [Candidatus Magasanikbacteria bacterium CG_4_10_14_0_2_um_filter_33_14]
MSQVFHIAKNKEILEKRFEIIKLIREFFWSRDFVEVEVPLIIKHPGQEPNISAIETIFHNEMKQEFRGYLHTSPEYTMKKMLAAGFTNIFYLGKTFRDEESFGGTHNPEFTMLEWYQVNSNMFDIMRDVEGLFKFIMERGMGNPEKLRIGTSEERSFNFERIEMKKLWKEIVNVDLDNYLTLEKMLELCKQKKYNIEDTESYEELFYRIFLQEIEPELKNMGAVIVYNYPSSMASLSRLSETDPNYAERFEVYIDGLELANAFSELTDKDEQLKRLQEEQQERERQGKKVYEIDMEFIEAVGQMPKSAGIALGVDRLIQVLTSCQNIDNVLTLPLSKLF